MFDKLRKDGNAFGETNDCTVIAHAITTNTSYANAHARLKNHGRKDKHGAYRHTQIRAMVDAGYKQLIDFKDYYSNNSIDLHDFFIKNYSECNHNRKYVTIKHSGHKEFGKTRGWELLKKLSYDPNIAIHVHVRSHVAAFKDGEIHDWSKNSARRIEKIEVYIKNGSNTPEVFDEISKYKN